MDFALWFLFKRNKDKDTKLLLLHTNTHGSGFAIWFSFSIATKIKELLCKDFYIFDILPKCGQNVKEKN